jgi:dTDP-4-amino-4,6-dideoxygalactose transaminase
VSNYYKYVALLDPAIERDAFKRAMREEHLVSMSGEVYSAPLHFHPVFAKVDRAALSVSEAVCATQVCLPIHSDMARDETERVVAAVRSVLTQMLSA